MWQRVPRFLRSFYFIASLLFVIWMVFFDRNDLISQLELRSKLTELEDQKAYYLERIKEVEKDHNELMSDSDLLEKFAREKYFMKRPNEDVYIVVEEAEE
ncbi:Cell division protein FtsB [Catalinimonas alkaloidigena]|uniref:Cell division protein FtsB n=1 Tax=Catalinimonas alkaloidigena TaxID=1075417 RepID=A0A1G9N6Z5_9BACT|nr:septum formation initiator family protein [Catalinimonas alkaloidigena]SDL81897.1 Cell division protein FtsB [Catalinimonas alkaloidigena]